MDHRRSSAVFLTNRRQSCTFIDDAYVLGKLQCTRRRHSTPPILYHISHHNDAPHIETLAPLITADFFGLCPFASTTLSCHGGLCPFMEHGGLDHATGCCRNEHHRRCTFQTPRSHHRPQQSNAAPVCSCKSSPKRTRSQTARSSRNRMTSDHAISSHSAECQLYGIVDNVRRTSFPSYSTPCDQGRNIFSPKTADQAGAPGLRHFVFSDCLQIADDVSRTCDVFRTRITSNEDDCQSPTSPASVSIHASPCGLLKSGCVVRSPVDGHSFLFSDAPQVQVDLRESHPGIWKHPLSPVTESSRKKKHSSSTTTTTSDVFMKRLLNERLSDNVFAAPETERNVYMFLTPSVRRIKEKPAIDTVLISFSVIPACITFSVLQMTFSANRAGKGVIFAKVLIVDSRDARSSDKRHNYFIVNLGQEVHFCFPDPVSLEFMSLRIEMFQQQRKKEKSFGHVDMKLSEQDKMTEVILWKTLHRPQTLSVWHRLFSCLCVCGSYSGNTRSARKVSSERF